jgi:hypothetical protein
MAVLDLADAHDLLTAAAAQIHLRADSNQLQLLDWMSADCHGCSLSNQIYGKLYQIRKIIEYSIFGSAEMSAPTKIWLAKCRTAVTRFA